ncbi:hypothetical protein [Mycolicibacter arupensis]|jgi:hypothetical protein|uniref:Uncharacterized protein n=1 Tax=Mycolicibacter arupensis TaxID=342002 RepID=A0A5C7Y8T3_9MYCO|nr:hypothetical protein [Mycolicibacter arupensis]TXI57997.1 MAG: hypothetical protein E6Q54_06905 [Mycolicibacter arupensis]
MTLEITPGAQEITSTVAAHAAASAASVVAAPACGGTSPFDAAAAGMLASVRGVQTESAGLVTQKCAGTGAASADSFVMLQAADEENEASLGSVLI